MTSIGNYVGFCMDNGVLLAEPSKCVFFFSFCFVCIVFNLTNTTLT